MLCPVSSNNDYYTIRGFQEEKWVSKQLWTDLYDMLTFTFPTVISAAIGKIGKHSKSWSHVYTHV